MTVDLNFISLFSGAGGLDLGFEAAGWKCLYASDIDPIAVETLIANQGVELGAHGAGFPDAVIRCEDVGDLTGRKILRRIQKKKGDVLAIVGGPPCQSWSSAGHQRGFEDPRGQLFKDYVRIAAELDVRWLVFENVRGLLTAVGPDGSAGGALEHIRRSLLAEGFQTEVELLNAADYGVPQRRVRLFMIGYRRGDRPAFPTPTHQDPSRLTLPLFDSRTTKPWVTLADCLSAIFPPMQAEIFRPAPALEEQLKSVRPGSGIRSPGKREATRPGGHWGYKQGAFLADQTLPARTVTASSQQDWIQDQQLGLRRLTPRECAAIQTFPPTYIFKGGKADQYRQIGNAVPPLLASAIASALRGHIEGTQDKGIDVEMTSELAPLHQRLRSAIEYTRKEQARNGDSRRAAPNKRRRTAVG